MEEGLKAHRPAPVPATAPPRRPVHHHGLAVTVLYQVLAATAPVHVPVPTEEAAPAQDHVPVPTEGAAPALDHVPVPTEGAAQAPDHVPVPTEGEAPALPRGPVLTEVAAPDRRDVTSDH